MSVEVGAVCGDGPGPQIDPCASASEVLFVLYIIVDSGLTSVVLLRKNT